MINITNGTMTRYRYAAATFVDGVWSKGSATSTTVAAHAEPTTYGQREEIAPEGTRSKQYIEVFVPTSFDVRGVSQYGADGADEIEHTKFPGRYRVQHVDVFDGFSELAELSHINLIAVRIGDQTW